MSNALVAADLMDFGLIPAINTAWSNPTIEEDSEPRTFQDLPFVSLNWLEVDIDMGGLNAAVSETNQAYTFEIIYYFAMPQAMGTPQNKVSRVKLAYANLLINQLQKGPGFGQLPNGTYIANMPIAHKVSAKDRSPRFEGSAMVRILFTCQAAASHH